MHIDSRTILREVRGLNEDREAPSAICFTGVDSTLSSPTHRRKRLRISGRQLVIARKHGTWMLMKTVSPTRIWELGRTEEAIAEYQCILKLNPNYPLVHYHLAQAYELKGRNDQARAEYERFRKFGKMRTLTCPRYSWQRKDCQDELRATTALMVSYWRMVRRAECHLRRN